jgi:hypothetical protein
MSKRGFGAALLTRPDFFRQLYKWRRILSIEGDIKYRFWERQVEPVEFVVPVLFETFRGCSI